MKKIKYKAILASLCLGLVVFTSVPNAFAQDNGQNNKDRIYGSNRIETSIEVSKNGWKDGSKYVVIAQGYDFADALSAAPLAKKYDAPIILNGNGKLPDSTVNELKRLKVENAIILGGDKVISKEVENQLKALKIDINRIYGQTRYETALKVAEEVGQGDTLFVTNGRTYADALSVSAIAAKKGCPILYTEKDNMIPAVKEYIKNHKISKIYFVGGEGVITDKVKNQVSNGERLSGSNRYETNKEVLEKFAKDLNFENVYFVTGQNFADALSVAPLASMKNAPIVLTNKNVNEDIEKLINSKIDSNSKLICIGGEAVVPSSILDKFNLDKPSFEIIEIASINSSQLW